MTARRDHDAILGLAQTATARQIKEAFRTLARAHHPDTNAGDTASDRASKRVARACEVLGDPATRRAYDERDTRGRFAAPGTGGPQAITVEGAGPVYHLDRRLAAPKSPDGDLRRRDAEQLDRTDTCRKPRRGGEPQLDDDVLAASES